MRRVTGIGGIFFQAKDPVALGAWYKKHLGIDVQEAIVLTEVPSIDGWVNLPFLVTRWEGSIPLTTDAGDLLEWRSPDDALCSACPPAVEIARLALERLEALSRRPRTAGAS